MIMDDLISSCKEALPPLGEGQPILGVTILELRLFSCRYVIGADDDLGAIFCGLTTFKGSYCKTHHKICYKGLPAKSL
jgi:hypothetical protein